jgi:hypothetical protein
MPMTLRVFCFVLVLNSVCSRWVRVIHNSFETEFLMSSWEIDLERLRRTLLGVLGIAVWNIQVQISSSE